MKKWFLSFKANFANKLIDSLLLFIVTLGCSYVILRKTLNAEDKKDMQTEVNKKASLEDLSKAKSELTLEIDKKVDKLVFSEYKEKVDVYFKELKDDVKDIKNVNILNEGRILDLWKLRNQKDGAMVFTDTPLITKIGLDSFFLHRKDTITLLTRK